MDEKVKQAALEECSNCPECMRLQERNEFVNLMTCKDCEIYYCFNCGIKLGTFIDGIEKAKEHYLVAFCRYVEDNKKSAK